MLEKTKYLRFLTWCGPLFLAVFIVFWGLMGNNIPPLSAGLSASEVGDIFRADARTIPLENAKADFVFLDPPYGTNIHYSDEPGCIGTLDVHGPGHGRSPSGTGYYDSMDRVIREIHRVLKNRRFFALYVCDSYQKKKENREKREENREPER